MAVMSEGWKTAIEIIVTIGVVLGTIALMVVSSL